MNIFYACPECHVAVRQPMDPQDDVYTCPHCQAQLRLTPQAIEGPRVARCLVCPSDELFVRKDFPQRLGVLIVIIGFTLSSIAWYYHLILWAYACLFGTALIDVALFFLVGDVLECYRCHAQYRDVANLEDHEAFDLETHEKHRQQAARLASLAGAPSGPASLGANADESHGA